MRATIDLDNELERIARAKAGAERKALSNVINEALRAYLPAKMVIEFDKETRISGPTISTVQHNVDNSGAISPIRAKTRYSGGAALSTDE